MATLAELKELAVHAVKGTAPSTFSVENVNDALKDGIKDLCGSINNFMKNRYDIYDIIITAADEYVPNKVMNAVGIFAEVQSVPQGQKALYKRRLGKTRAKKFITRATPSGVYETFRLDTDTFEVNTNSIGTAITVDFERMLDGAESITELMDIIVEGLTEAVYQEVQRVLRAATDTVINTSASTNLVSVSGFDANEMLRLVGICRAYGSSAVIFATPEFVAAMGPDAIVPVSGNIAGVYSPADIEAIHNQGYINIFRGTPVVQIPQSFMDESNTTTWIDPQLAYVLPTGGEKVVKVTLEGATQMHDFTNRDNSIEVHAYKKMGAGIAAYNNWCIYQNTAIPQTYGAPYENI